MVAFPNWLLGRHCQVTIQPGAMDAGGNFIPASQQSLVGTLEEVDVDSTVSDENISPMDIPLANHVMIETDLALSFIEILKRNQLNILAYCAWNYTHGYVIFNQGSQTWSGYFLFGNLSHGVRKGKSTARLQVMQVIVTGATSPSYG